MKPLESPVIAVVSESEGLGGLGLYCIFVLLLFFLGGGGRVIAILFFKDVRG